MLTKLRIKNFKAWKDTGDIRLAPLTVLFGANSSGKSSLGHLLLALKQTAASADRRRALHTGDETSLIDLGTFVECLHGHDREAQLELTLDWSLREPLQVKDPLDQAQAFSGTHLLLNSTLAASAQEQPVVRRLHYELHDAQAKAAALSATLSRSTEGKVQLQAQPYRLVHADGRKWPLEPPEKFYRISDRSLARYKNSDFLADFALAIESSLAGLSYLGPLREHPHRTYGWSGNTPEDVGAKGEYAIACILAAEAAKRKLNRGYKRKTQPFAAWPVTTLIVDTNVILVANRQHADVSEACILSCAKRLQEIMTTGRIAIDDGYRILGECRHKTRPRVGKRPGDAFVKWLLRNNANPSKCDQIPLADHPDRGFESFPDDPRLASFDPPDRMFVGVAASHAQRPPIAQAADSKWLGWAPALAEQGITVDFLCPQEIQSFDDKKKGRKGTPR